MSTRFCFFFIKTCTANNHFLLVLDISIQNLTKGQDFWHAILNSQHVETKVGLHLGHLEKIVKDNVGRRVAFNLDYKANAFTIGLITYGCNALNSFFLNQANNMLMYLGFINHIREFRYNNTLTTRLSGFNLCTRTKDNGTFTGLISFVDP